MGHTPAVAITAHTVTSALGVGVVAHETAVRLQQSGLTANRASAGPAVNANVNVNVIAPPATTAPPPSRQTTPALATYVGLVQAVDSATLPTSHAAWDSRATRLAWLALHADGFAANALAAVQRHGAHRVGCVLGSSASTIASSEQAYRQLDADGGFPAGLRFPALHSPHAVAAFTARVLGLLGPVVTVSTACSSSARAFGQAQRWLNLGLVDAVVVGGLDALCDSVLWGFQSLGLVAPQPCTPFDARRCGISVGEAAGFALLERAPTGAAQGHPAPQAWLLSCGDSNDAHHMSSPHPQGLGAELALDHALAGAGLNAQAVDYLNLHGTGTPQNDAVEAAMVARRYRANVHASATKGLTGHTMGAAGMVEAALCLVALKRGWCSGSAQVGVADAALGARFGGQLQLQPRQAAVAVAASHSFGFGGNNCVLLFGATRGGGAQHG
jgi:3-oxoacyl-[acyl-carrier-protein] synthase I